MTFQVPVGCSNILSYGGLVVSEAIELGSNDLRLLFNFFRLHPSHHFSYQKQILSLGNTVSMYRQILLKVIFFYVSEIISNIT